MVQPRRCGKQKSKMFWAAFGYGVRTQLVPMEGDPEAPRGGVTARVYREVLDRHLPPILGFGNIFMHDNAPIHRAHIIREWLWERGIEVMNWPPYSPDLNLIENLWALLKAEMYILYPELVSAPNNAETLDLLISCAIDTWDRIGEQLLNRLIDTMERRVKAVLDAEGWYTKY
jgi:transposase